MWMFVNIECSYRTAIWMFLLIQYMGAQDYEISPKIGCVFRARTASGTPDYEIFPKIGYVFGVWTALGAWGCEISLK